MKILIIGSDSYIAQKFIENYKSVTIKGISKSVVHFKDEEVVNDFNKIELNIFNGFDTVINFAAIVHRPEIKDINFYDEINHKLAVLNAQKAKQARVKLFVQMSTIAVYGNASVISIETPNHPNTPYGQSKLNADLELLAMQDENFKVAIVRPPMVYGGGKAPGNMMRLIKLANKSLPLPFKRIDNQRDFINVHNLVQYLSIIAEKKLSGIYLISDHQPISTEYLLTKISEFLDKKGPLILLPDWILKIIKVIRPKDYEKLYGTLQIKTNFPFEEMIQRYSVEQGIQEMVDWFKLNK